MSRDEALRAVVRELRIHVDTLRMGPPPGACGAIGAAIVDLAAAIEAALALTPAEREALEVAADWLRQMNVGDSYSWKRQEAAAVLRAMLAERSTNE